MNDEFLPREQMIGITNLLVGILCLIVAVYAFRQSFLIIKEPTDMLMADIDSQIYTQSLRGHLSKVEKQHYEFCRNEILSEYHARIAADKATWLAGVVGMLVVGTYCVVTGIVLCRKRSK